MSLLSETFRTIAYDHRGSGASIAPSNSISLETLVDDLFCVLDAFEVKSCILAAESAGALTALAAALRNPKRVAHLILVDGLYYSNIDEHSDTFLQGLRMNYTKTLDHFVEWCVPETDCEHIKHWGRKIINRASPEDAIALRLAHNQVDFRQDFIHITQPTLILHGDKDIIVPLAKAQETAKLLPNAQLQILNGAGHVPTLTRPTEVAKAISEFLKSQDLSYKK